LDWFVFIGKGTSVQQNLGGFPPQFRTQFRKSALFVGGVFAKTLTTNGIGPEKSQFRFTGPDAGNAGRLAISWAKRHESPVVMTGVQTKRKTREKN